MDKDKEIKKELNKLNKIFKNIDDDRKKIVENLIKNAAFMAVTLQELQEYIAEHGCTEEYQNGANQFGKKKSSEVEVYNSMIKNYSTIIKQLLDLAGDVGKEDKDDLMEFLSRGRK